MSTQGPPCQSCGMPLSMDSGEHGTELDGSKSTEYCSHCYQDGAFVEPDLTMEEMMARVKEKLDGLGMPPFVVQKAQDDIPHLHRWDGEPPIDAAPVVLEMGF